MRRSLAIAAALLAVMAASAFAATTVRDRRDSGTRFDVKSVVLAFPRPTSLLYTIRMQRPWATSLLRNEGRNCFVCLYLWKGGATPQPGKQDFQVCADFATGKLSATVLEVETGVTSVIPVTRPIPSSIRFDVPRSLLPAEATEFYWLTATKLGKPARAFDIVPDRGPRKQTLG